MRYMLGRKIQQVKEIRRASLRRRYLSIVQKGGRGYLEKKHCRQRAQPVQRP